MKNEIREEIMNRYGIVDGQRKMTPKDSPQYAELSKIGKLILTELQIGNHPRHIMFMVGTHYDFRCL